MSGIRRTKGAGYRVERWSAGRISYGINIEDSFSLTSTRLSSRPSRLNSK